MKTQQVLDTTEVLQQIIHLSASQQSGTLFLTTTDNKACHIVFDNGRISGMAYGPVKGLAVADLLGRLPVERCVFNSQTQLPLTTRARIEADSDIFKRLGMRRVAGVATPSSSARLYRGHSLSEASEIPGPPTVKKTQRIYRGHKLND